MTQIEQVIGGRQGNTIAIESRRATFNFWWDPVNGDDRNSGREEAFPIQTVESLYERMPLYNFNGARIIINIAGQPAAGQAHGFGANVNLTGPRVNAVVRNIIVGSGETRPSISYRGPRMIRSTLATGVNGVAMTAVADVGQRTQIDVAGAGWTANDLRGKFARISRGGVLVIFEIPITENDADSIFLDLIGISGLLVLATDTLEIVEPGVRLIGDANDDNATLVSLSGIGNIASGTGGLTNTFERLAFQFLFASNQSAIFDRCSFISSVQLTRCRCDFVNCSFLGGGSFLFASESTGFTPTSRADAAGNPINAGPNFGALYFTPDATSLMTIGANPGYSGTLEMLRNWSVYGVNIGADRAGIEIWGPGSLLIVRPTIALQGIQLAGSGIRCRHGAQAGISSLTTITGPAGAALRLESGAAINYGVGVGQFSEVAGFNNNFTRKNEGSAVAPIGDASRIFLFV